MSFQWIRPELEQNASMMPEPPTIPQTAPPAEDGGIADLIAQAKANTTALTPAQSVAERFGAAPGSDIGVVARKPAAAAKPSDPDPWAGMTTQQRNELVRLATEAGAFENPADLKRTFTGNSVKAARDHAAMVHEATRQGAFTTTEDTQTRKVARTHIQGYTAGYGGER
jgi:hypothetical protein